jgi:hypothetical protein
VTPLEKSVLALGEGLQQIQAEQEYMRMRERAHRNTMESTNARVIWWSFIEAGCLVLMSVGQIMYLRRFFEVRFQMAPSDVVETSQAWTDCLPITTCGLGSRRRAVFEVGMERLFRCGGE